MKTILISIFLLYSTFTFAQIVEGTRNLVDVLPGAHFMMNKQVFYPKGSYSFRVEDYVSDDMATVADIMRMFKKSGFTVVFT